MTWHSTDLDGGPTFRWGSAGTSPDEDEHLAKKGGRHSARRDRGPQDRQDLLGRGLVRSPGIVQRLRKPFAARPNYVRNGSVCHLEINQGEILAKVAGSELYNIRIPIKTLPANKWKTIKHAARPGGLAAGTVAGQAVRSRHAGRHRPQRGLFPLPGEISLNCGCPDWAVMCKHVAAVLYGVSARLDQKPELLFKLRGVDHEELIAADAEAAVSAATSRGKSKRLAGGELADVFGIDLDTSEVLGRDRSGLGRRLPKR